MSKKALFEDMVFNDALYAASVRDECGKKLVKVKKGLIIAGIASVLSAIAFLFEGTTIGILCQLPAFVCALISYIVGGGFGTAVKWALKVGQIGWLIVPFPIDIVTGVCGIIAAIVGFFFFPIVFVYLNYRQIKKNYDAAEQYLSYCQPNTVR